MLILNVNNQQSAPFLGDQSDNYSPADMQLDKVLKMENNLT